MLPIKSNKRKYLKLDCKLNINKKVKSEEITDLEKLEIMCTIDEIQGILINNIINKV